MKKLPLLALAILLLSGCPKQPEKQPATTDGDISEQLELIPVRFAELNGWKQDNLVEFEKVFQTNCEKILKLKREFIAESKIKIKTKDYQNVCRLFMTYHNEENFDFKLFIEDQFKPNLVQSNGDAVGKFTSYYESEIFASMEKHGDYQYPVYGKPHDLVEVNLKEFDDKLPPKRLVGRIEGNKMRPYYTRAEIENGAIDAPILLWANNPVDIHIMQIQGSAVAQMDDGRRLRIGYADNNGHRFRGIGGILLSHKLLPNGKADMISIKKWLNANPQKAKEMMQLNNRYIFHKISHAEGPLGAYGIPLTAGRSLAVDRQYIPLGSILWLETTLPNKQDLKRLVAAQDIGSAIKGAVRGDFFWGSGGDEVLRMAGSMNSVGHYYIFIPKGADK